MTVIDSLAAPAAILAGDLNDTPGSAVLQRLSNRWRVADTGPTFPADRPDRRIDYVAWTPVSEWTLVSQTVIAEAVASDHRPVLVVLRR